MSREEYERLNAGCRFPDKIEGYWRQDKDASDIGIKERLHLPWPVPFEVEGYNMEEFIGRLVMKQMDSRIKVERYRGISMHRLTGNHNGNSEFELEGWKWPTGYVAYLTMGVPPSRAFYKFVTHEDLPTLPTYGRSDD